MDVLFDHPLITVWYHARQKVVHHKILGPVLAEDGEVFKRALLTGADALQRYGAGKWLSDDRMHSTMPGEVQQWAHEVWFPRTCRAGWKYWAIVKPEKVVTKMFVARLASTFSGLGVATEFFQDVGDAMNWLQVADGIPRTAETG